MNALKWIEQRLPIKQFWHQHFTHYFVPKNLNFWYLFGSLLIVVLLLQMITGILLAMHYQADTEQAFDSVQYIKREVVGGWFLVNMHTTGASLFFVLIYLHMFRSLLYGSYKRPRELVWILGMLMYLAIMATAFFGYLLPWGQMSYWGAEVILNLFETIPFVGDTLALWMRGDDLVSDVTLRRFYVLHFVIPFLIVVVVLLHIIAVRHVGSNNPDGIDLKKQPKGNQFSQDAPLDSVPFHPYYTTKDLFGLSIFLIVFFAIVFFFPEMGGFFVESANYTPANPLVTPDEIRPIWYFTPFYAILRAVPSFGGTQVWGVVTMIASILIFFLLPWLDRSAVKSIRYKGRWSKVFLIGFVFSFIALGYLGTQSPTQWNRFFCQILTVIYFAFFVLMPLYSRWDKTKPLPTRLQ